MLALAAEDYADLLVVQRLGLLDEKVEYKGTEKLAHPPALLVVGPVVAGVAYLWRDWGPFASSVAVYLLFYGITRYAWRREAALPTA